MQTQSNHLADMSWPQVRMALDAGHRAVLFAAGSTEQHGPHLPLATDALIGDYVADGVAARLEGTLMAPTVRIGVSDHHMAFPGTITVTADVFTSLIGAYVKSLAAHGFDRIFIMPSHGGNFGPLRDYIDDINGRHGEAHVYAFTDLTRFVGCVAEEGREDGISAEVSGGHAGEGETSMVLALRPDLVAMDHAVPGFVGDLNEEFVQSLFDHGMMALSDVGILGDPRPADAARGQRYLDRLIEAVSTHFSTESGVPLRG